MHFSYVTYISPCKRRTKPFFEIKENVFAKCHENWPRGSGEFEKLKKNNIEVYRRRNRQLDDDGLDKTKQPKISF